MNSATATPAAAASGKQPSAPSAPAHTAFWLWVMCLTGVDYFSTLGYQPSLAFEAVGILAPLATVVLVVVTLCGALPIYCYVARESSQGQGSIAMLERLLRGWTGKFMVLTLLGFAATDFVITKTLSAADAAEHIVHNQYWEVYGPRWLQHPMDITMILLVLLGGMFLKGFREVIVVAVGIVGSYLLLNLVVIALSLGYLLGHAELLTQWSQRVASGDWAFQGHVPIAGHGVLAVLGVCLLFFPKLALGLSGFETGVAVMPLVRGNADDDPEQPAGRIRNTRKLLALAAVIMSLMLLGSATVTATLIPADALQRGGQAANRALAYIAHGEGPHKVSPLFGAVFGTAYDISTVLILWFAGASAMSGLLNLVPRYLPRFGMAPEWASATRPLVLVFTATNLFVTWIFDASVEAQGGAYATGVMVLMSSAAVAVLIDRWRKRRGWFVLWRIPWLYGLIACVFFYTTVTIIIEKPEGIKIAAVFILAVMTFSMISRLRRSTEMRFEGFEFTDASSRLLWDSLAYLEFPVLVPHRPGGRPVPSKENEIRKIHRLGPDTPIVFIEASLGDTSEFTARPLIEVTQDQGRFVVKVKKCVSVAHAIAKVALELSKGGKPPELHFGWSDESPLAANLNFVLFGQGNVPWLVRELLERAEPDPNRRPRVVIG